MSTFRSDLISFVRDVLALSYSNEPRPELDRLADKYQDLLFSAAGEPRVLAGLGIGDLVTDEELRALIVLTIRNGGYGTMHEEVLVRDVTAWITTEAQASVRRGLRAMLLDGTLTVQEYEYAVVDRPRLMPGKLAPPPTETVAPSTGREPETESEPERDASSRPETEHRTEVSTDDPPASEKKDKPHRNRRQTRDWEPARERWETWDPDRPAKELLAAIAAELECSEAAVYYRAKADRWAPRASRFNGRAALSDIGVPCPSCLLQTSRSPCQHCGTDTLVLKNQLAGLAR